MIARVRHNLSRARFGRHELSGALGDLGTFLPLLLAMSGRGLDFGASLLFAGACNVATAMVFAIPMAVQPMKAIAAIAVGEGLRPGEMVAAGAIVAAIVLLLSAFGVVTHLARVLPRSVVRGIQLALGLTLFVHGMRLIAGAGGFFDLDGYGTAIAAAVITLVFGREGSRVPAALLLFFGGIAIATIARPSAAIAIELTLTFPTFAAPTASDFADAWYKAALPQLPLTLLNSVIAVCALARDLYPGESTPARTVGVSVGLMNLVGMWFGAMPVCHGAGGLAAQHRFGARTNGAPLFLGGAMIALALLFGGTLAPIGAAFPASILGVLLAFSGIELALVAREETRREDAFVVLATAGVSLGLSSVAVGTLVGILLAAWFAFTARR